jgi:nicotinamidase/pyrazinamidase
MAKEKMRIFYDVDTQNDFMNKDGALYVPDAELIKPNLKLLTNFARENIVPLIGSVDKHFGTPEYKHREGELARWSGPFPDHCMDGTFGQEKIAETTLKININRFEDAYDEGLYIQHTMYQGYPKEPIPKEVREFWKGNPKEMQEVWEENLKGIDYGLLDLAFKQIKDVAEKKQPQRGIYFEKQSYDIFTNPAFPAFLEQAGITEAVVYGVATDYCVKAAVLGMQKQNIQCYVVEDAIKGVFPETTKTALEEMARAGAKFITTKDVLEGRI